MNELEVLELKSWIRECLGQLKENLKAWKGLIDEPIETFVSNLMPLTDPKIDSEKKEALLQIMEESRDTEQILRRQWGLEQTLSFEFPQARVLLASLSLEDKKLLEDWVIEGLTLKSFYNFIKNLRKIVGDFEQLRKNYGGKDYLLLSTSKPGEEKSFWWVLKWAILLGLQPPSYIASISDKFNDFSFLEKKPFIVLLDDALYSGLQATSYIKSFLNKNPIAFESLFCIMAAYGTKRGINRLQEDISQDYLPLKNRHWFFPLIGEEIRSLYDLRPQSLSSDQCLAYLYYLELMTQPLCEIMIEPNDLYKITGTALSHKQPDGLSFLQSLKIYPKIYCPYKLNDRLGFLQEALHEYKIYSSLDLQVLEDAHPDHSFQVLSLAHEQSSLGRFLVCEKSSIEKTVHSSGHFVLQRKQVLSCQIYPLDLLAGHVFSIENCSYIFDGNSLYSYKDQPNPLSPPRRIIAIAPHLSQNNPSTDSY